MNGVLDFLFARFSAGCHSCGVYFLVSQPLVFLLGICMPALEFLFSFLKSLLFTFRSWEFLLSHSLLPEVICFYFYILRLLGNYSILDCNSFGSKILR